jgi:2-polyprenyl-3-methyl-5-hydroxy-6-metoxy-1,4-benzoquinol methylase
MPGLEAQFGPIDIYLFDQMLKGRIPRGSRVLDAGCGSGRNLVYLIREGFEVFAVDADPGAIAAVRELAPRLPATNFRAERLEATTLDDSSVDFVISSAVLHFARDDREFQAMLLGSWRPLKPGGIFFCRLASTIGIVDPLKTTVVQNQRSMTTWVMRKL